MKRRDNGPLFDWALSIKPGPVLLGLVLMGESCDSGRRRDSHLTQVRNVEPVNIFKKSFLPLDLHSVWSFFSGVCWTWSCLALGIWCLLCLLQSSTLRLLISSLRSPAGWVLRRSSSPGLCSAMSSCEVTCSLKPANRACCWPLIRPQDALLTTLVSTLKHEVHFC